MGQMEAGYLKNLLGRWQKVKLKDLLLVGKCRWNVQMVKGGLDLCTYHSYVNTFSDSSTVVENAFTLHRSGRRLCRGFGVALRACTVRMDGQHGTIVGGGNFTAGSVALEACSALASGKLDLADRVGVFRLNSGGVCV